MIEGFVGLIGHGKTMLAVKHCRRIARARNAVVAANIKLDLPGIETVQLAIGDDGLDLEQLRALADELRAKDQGLVLLLDEVGILMPARMWASFPVDLMFMLSQSRKLSLDVVWTSQDVEQVDAFLRRLTSVVHKVRARPSPTIERRVKGTRPWFMTVSTYLPRGVDRPDKRVGRALVRYRRELEGWYDTDELVRPAARLGRSRRSRSAPVGA